MFIALASRPHLNTSTLTLAIIGLNLSQSLGLRLSRILSLILSHTVPSEAFLSSVVIAEPTPPHSRVSLRELYPYPYP